MCILIYNASSKYVSSLLIKNVMRERKGKIFMEIDLNSSSIVEDSISFKSNKCLNICDDKLCAESKDNKFHINFSVYNKRIQQFIFKRKMFEIKVIIFSFHIFIVVLLRKLI